MNSLTGFIALLRRSGGVDEPSQGTDREKADRENADRHDRGTERRNPPAQLMRSTGATNALSAMIDTDSTGVIATATRPRNPSTQLTTPPGTNRIARTANPAEKAADGEVTRSTYPACYQRE